MKKSYAKQDGSRRGSGTYVQFTDFGKRMTKKIEYLIDLIDPENKAK